MNIVLVIPPRIKDDFGYTPAGVAALKGSLSAAGFSSKILDFNSELDYRYESDSSTLTTIENFFMYYDFYNPHVFVEVEKYLTDCANTILSHNPQWVGISVFSYNSHRSTRLLSIKLKQINPDIKIVIGGGGIATDYSFPEALYEQRIIDAYIRGEGELSLVELLKDNMDYPGINGLPPVQIDDIESLAYPDYSDYGLQTYKNKRGLVAIPVTGSRGCVARCSFCDVASQWPKYRFRSGNSIATEIKSHSELYKAKEFRFTDSLVNGSMSAFRNMCQQLAEYRMSLDKEDRFVWDGQFIVRGKSTMPPEDFDVLAESGAKTLLIGVESGSQNVLDHMKKMYKTADLDYTVEQLHRVGVQCRFLMIVGYPTETESDFQETLDMFTKYQKYAGSTIQQVNLGLTLNLLPHTPLDDNKEQNNIIKLNNHINDWICLDNPTLTYQERLRRRIYIQKFVIELGYNVFEEENYRKQLFSSLNEMQSYNTTSATYVSGNFKYDSSTGELKDAATINVKIPHN